MFIPLNWLAATTITITSPDGAVDEYRVSSHVVTALTDYDSFYLPQEKDEYCGPNRSLRSIRKLLVSMGGYDDAYRIADDVLMEQWEHRQDAPNDWDTYWTPYCYDPGVPDGAEG